MSFCNSNVSGAYTALGFRIWHRIYQMQDCCKDMNGYLLKLGVKISRRFINGYEVCVTGRIILLKANPGTAKRS